MREAFVQSLQNLRANKLRSFLTMFGILWGMVSVVVLSAMGEGFQQGNVKVLRELGKNIGIGNGKVKLLKPFVRHRGMDLSGLQSGGQSVRGDEMLFRNENARSSTERPLWWLVQFVQRDLELSRAARRFGRFGWILNW